MNHAVCSNFAQLREVSAYPRGINTLLVLVNTFDLILMFISVYIRNSMSGFNIIIGTQYAIWCYLNTNTTAVWSVSSTSITSKIALPGSRRSHADVFIKWIEFLFFHFQLNVTLPCLTHVFHISQTCHYLTYAFNFVYLSEEYIVEWMFFFFFKKRINMIAN